MSNFAARRALAPVAASVAATAFLIAGAITVPSYAQNSNPHPRPAAAKAATSMRPESVDQRVQALHAQLKITAAEENDWKAVAEAMRSNADDMKKLIDQVHSDTPREKRTAVEDLQTYQKFAQLHAQGLDKLTAAFSTLYNAMTPEQKANADKVFRNFEGRHPGKSG